MEIPYINEVSGWKGDNITYAGQTSYSNGETTLFIQENVTVKGVLNESVWYYVILSEPYPSHFKTLFYSKSKQEAISFAKKYMKDHPNG